MLIILVIVGIPTTELPAFAMSASSSDKNPKMLMKTELSKTDAYAHEGFYITIWLYISDQRVENIEENLPPALKSGEFSYISNITPLPRRKEVELKGEKYLAVPIKKFVVTLHEAGKYHLNEGKYEVIISNPVIVNDPFFGRIRRTEREKIEISSPAVDFKIRNLPPHKGNVDFSGAVGNFEIETIIPPGDIIIDKDATAIFRIKGSGLLGADILPEYHHAFGDGNKLKSVSDNNDMYFNGEEVISEKNIICNFVPTSFDNCQIGSAEFCYFNPSTGKYHTVRTNPVDINVKSSTIKRERIDI